MARHGCGRLKIDSYIVVPQRFVSCNKCATVYRGPKERVICLGCGKDLKTKNIHCDKLIPTGQWIISNQRKKPDDRQRGSGKAISGDDSKA